MRILLNLDKSEWLSLVSLSSVLSLFSFLDDRTSLRKMISKCASIDRGMCPAFSRLEPLVVGERVSEKRPSRVLANRNNCEEVRNVQRRAATRTGGGEDRQD